MEMKEIETRLDAIREGYDTVRQMTETIEVDSVEECSMLIEKRGKLLDEIYSQQSSLDQGFHGWRDLCTINENFARICVEIQKSITIALTLDSILKEKLLTAMEKTKREIKTMTTRSNATLSYARQARV
jgi:hypothetical protein